jgi:hypothetical protein
LHGIEYLARLAAAPRSVDEQIEVGRRKRHWHFAR